jgi:hypothetical protein
MPQSTIQRGHSGAKKVPYICAGCNNGWMSRMETRTRPILMPLIQGTMHRISTFDQKYLATWAAKTAMVAEYTMPDKIAIPDSERLWMLANLAPPPNWTIWIADYRGTKWRNLAISHHMAVLPTKTTKPGEIAPNTHFTSFGIGNLFVQIVGTSTGAKFAVADDSVSDLRRIWPANTDAISWPPIGMLNDEKADFVANSLSRLSGIPSSY